MIGIAIGLLRPRPFPEAVAAFRELQAEYHLPAAEIHLETSLYPAALHLERPDDRAHARSLRRHVEVFGVHLPFMDMDPLSLNPAAQKYAWERLGHSIATAAHLDADYAVCHCRSSQGNPDDAPLMKKAALWQPLVDFLAEQAERAGIAFCLENADNLRRPNEITELIAASPCPVSCCLDIGHLYERIYPAGNWRRRAMYYFDHYSPRPFAVRSGLPLGRNDDWPEILRSFGSSLACVHLHNHNGRSAHQPLFNGAIDLQPLAAMEQDFLKIPLIMESDYRSCSLTDVKKDIRILEGIIAHAK